MWNATYFHSLAKHTELLLGEKTNPSAMSFFGRLSFFFLSFLFSIALFLLLLLFLSSSISPFFSFVPWVSLPLCVPFPALCPPSPKPPHCCPKPRARPPSHPRILLILAQTSTSPSPPLPPPTSLTSTNPSFSSPLSALLLISLSLSLPLLCVFYQFFLFFFLCPLCHLPPYLVAIPNTLLSPFPGSGVVAVVVGVRVVAQEVTPILWWMSRAKESPPRLRASAPNVTQPRILKPFALDRKWGKLQKYTPQKIKSLQNTMISPHLWSLISYLALCGTFILDGKFFRSKFW